MIHRRATLAAPLLLALPRLAQAQDGYPNRAITVVSGYAPGGVTDVTSRAVAERMGRELAVPVVVENRVGAATAVANTAVAQARPDGYTLLMGTSTLAINPGLQPNLTPKEPLKDLAPVGMVFRTAFVLHVHPDLPVHTTAELIAWCKANPGKLNFGSSGTGAVNHLAQALFAQKAGIEVTHVPYRGGAPALLDLRAGRIQAMFQAVWKPCRASVMAPRAASACPPPNAPRCCRSCRRWRIPCRASMWCSGRACSPRPARRPRCWPGSAPRCTPRPRMPNSAPAWPGRASASPPAMRPCCGGR